MSFQAYATEDKNLVPRGIDIKVWSLFQTIRTKTLAWSEGSFSTLKALLYYGSISVYYVLKRNIILV